MQYVCLLIVVCAGVGLAQSEVGEIERNERLFREGHLNPSSNGGSPQDTNQAILSALNIPTAPYVNRQPLSAGVISVRQLEHKIPKQALKAFERAAKLSKADKHVEAVQELKQAIAKDPDFVEAHINLGAQYYLLYKPLEAEAALRRALELDPASSSAYANLAAVKILIREPVAAEQFARRALALAPQNERAQRIVDQLRLSNH